MDVCRVLVRGGAGEIEVKKSRFIAEVRPVQSEDEAAEFVAGVRKKFWDAVHHCSAFTVGMRHEITRCSDDGEPAQTAGRPILDVLLGEDVHNVCAVVTRYFGGTLLGTGGLVRAYSGAAKLALADAQIVDKTRAFRMEVEADYSLVGKIQHLAGQNGIAVLGSEYTDSVRFSLLVPVGLLDKMEKELVEGTSGRAKVRRGDEVWFGVVNKEVILF